MTYVYATARLKDIFKEKYVDKISSIRNVRKCSSKAVYSAMTFM